MKTAYVNGGHRMWERLLDNRKVGDSSFHQSRFGECSPILTFLLFSRMKLGEHLLLLEWLCDLQSQPPGYSGYCTTLPRMNFCGP